MPRPALTSRPSAPPRSRAKDALTRRDLLRWRVTDAAPDPSGHWIRLHRIAMACRFEVTLSDDRASDVPRALEALAEAERVESRLTVFRHTSEVMRVNRAAGNGPVAVDAELFDLFVRCQRLHQTTGGAFDITSTPLSRAWGFLDRAPTRPSDAAIESARALVGMSRIALDGADRTVHLPVSGMSLNFGSIGKGFAVQRIAEALAARGPVDALVSAGGSSVAAVGTRRWTVDVVARAAGRRVARVRLGSAALGTSGAGEQFVDVDGVRRAHVIDPRTGWPVAGVLSASVVTDDAADADALATAVFVGGEGLARSYCDAHSRTLVLLTPDGTGETMVIGSHPAVSVEVV